MVCQLSTDIVVDARVPVREAGSSGAASVCLIKEGRSNGAALLWWWPGMVDLMSMSLKNVSLSTHLPAPIWTSLPLYTYVSRRAL